MDTLGRSPVPTSEHAPPDERQPGLEEQWFGVPAVVSVDAPTRAAADALAQTIARDRLSQQLDFALLNMHLAEKAPLHRPDGSISWLVDITFAIKAFDDWEATSEVRRVCRSLGAHADWFLHVGNAHPIPDQERPDARCRRVLSDAVEILVDHLREELVEVRAGTPIADTTYLSYHLPPRLAGQYTPELLERWVDIVEVVGAKLLSYPDTYLACTAEELAAHAIIDEANELLSLVEESGDESEICAAIREKVDEIHELAFEDHDVLMLFDDRLTGIEEDEDVIATMRLANLSPADWFEPFRNGRS